MGCGASKTINVAEDVYRPPPTSIAVFDILSIEEPWLKSDIHQQGDDEKEEPTMNKQQLVPIPNPLLEKLNAIEDDPRTWEEVSKALDDIKPTLRTPPAPPVVNNDPPPPAAPAPVKDSLAGSNKQLIVRKKGSFHTLEELEVQSKKTGSEIKAQLKKSDPESLGSGQEVVAGSGLNTRSMTRDSSNPDLTGSGLAAVTTGGLKPVKENIFVIRDKLEREKEGKTAPIVKRDPLSDYQEICPPGGSESVVIYTTSLGGVRRTFEDCNTLRSILEYHRVVFDERDVSLHGGYLHELRELLGEVACVPRMFVKGRYIGGVEEVVSLNETGRLGRILNWTRVERGVGRLGCEGCGGARFLPCLDCGGSCKIVVDDAKERCPSCNENGLVLCPVCSV